jgi:uncharacterized protein YlxW (UPF0749 family)
MASTGSGADRSSASPPAVTGPPARRDRRASALIGLLTLVLGFAIAIQLHSRSTGDALAGARQDDLVAILDDQNNQEARLRTRVAQLQAELTKLREDGTNSAAARAQAQEQADAIGILTGTLPASGPGVTVRITDPRRALKAADLLDVVEELRGAGAETIQFGPVRVGVSSAFADVNGGVVLDGTPLAPPFVVKAIGPAQTMDTALNIPGGVAATARTAGGAATVTRADQVAITATRTLPPMKWASPVPR